MKRTIRDNNSCKTERVFFFVKTGMDWTVKKKTKNQLKKKRPKSER